VRIAVALAAAAVLAGCGGGNGASSDASAPVKRYLAALGRADAPGACRELSPDSRRKLAEFGDEHLHAASCEQVVGLLLRNPAGGALRRLGGAAVTRVQVDGDHADVYVKGLDRPVKVVRTGGRWQIDSAPTGEAD
jgi:hypothetical protein